MSDVLGEDDGGGGVVDAGEVGEGGEGEGEEELAVAGADCECGVGGGLAVANKGRARRVVGSLLSRIDCSLSFMFSVIQSTISSAASSPNQTYPSHQSAISQSAFPTQPGHPPSSPALTSPSSPISANVFTSRSYTASCTPHTLVNIDLA